MANKNLKVEVFDSNIGSMKKNKRYEDEIAGLEKDLATLSTIVVKKMVF